MGVGMYVEAMEESFSVCAIAQQWLNKYIAGPKECLRGRSKWPSYGILWYKQPWYKIAKCTGAVMHYCCLNCLVMDSLSFISISPYNIAIIVIQLEVYV